MDIQIGTNGVAQTIVSEQNTAQAMKSGSLPVFATPAMCALMEEAAVAAVQPLLDEGYTTVGTKLSISHDAPSALHQVIEAKAVITAVEGRKISYTVEAWSNQTCIGKGVHERFVIKAESFMAKLMNK